MLEQATDFCEQNMESAILVLDAGFSSGKVLKAARSNMQVVVRARKNCVAYLPAERDTRPKRGRPRKYGKKLKLSSLFDSNQRGKFSKATTCIYEKSEEVQYRAINLYWKPCKSLVRFVLARTSRGAIVIMCSDLTMDPLDVLHAYCRRAKIETFFDTLKNTFGGLMYHFWSVYLKPISRRPRHNAPEPDTSENTQATTVTAEAIEKFVHLHMLIIGVSQLIAHHLPQEVLSRADSWLRTSRTTAPSEFIFRIAVTNLVRDFLSKASGGWIMQIIRDRQANEFQETQFDRAG
jgi:hypothetical protein